MSPAQGPIAGGTVVTISGGNFTGATVRLDRAAVTPLSQSDTAITLRMAAHDNGYVVLSIANASGSAYGEYLYVPPRLDELPPGFITTVAGVGNYVRTFGPANRVNVQPNAIAADGAGNLYVAEAGQHRVTRIDAAGEIHEFAGGNFFLGNDVPDNVPAIDGGVSFPWGLAAGPNGNLYIGTHSPLLRMVDPRTNLITTVAGDNHIGFSGDGGLARDAKIGSATAVVADASNVYFIDWDNVRVRRIDAAGVITTVAGNGTTGYAGDGGPAIHASLNFGTSDDGSLTLDPQGNLFIADSANGAIRRVDRATGIITTFYTPSQRGPDAVGGFVRSLAFDRDGNLYYGGGGRIVKVNAGGTFVSAWGAGGYGLSEDGPITASMRIGHIMSILIEPNGSILFADDFFARVRRINLAANRLETIAGIFPAYQNENGPAIAAPLMNDNNDLAIDRDGNLLIGDFRLRRLDRSGNLQTIAGATPDPSIFDNVPAQKMVNTCVGIDVTRDGIDLASSSEIAHIDANWILHRLGGADPNCGTDGDGGPFRNAHLCQPWDSARDAAGNLYIADTNNNRIRRVDGATGIIETIAGKGGPPNGLERYGQGTFCGDGGAAVDACLNTPYGIAVDADGSVFFSENWFRLRRIDPSGRISTFATRGGMTKLVFGTGGYLYAIAGNQPGRFSRNGAYTPIAGTGEQGFGGDGGPALLARTRAGGQAAGIAVDAEGNLFFSDAANRRVRAVRFGAVLAPQNATVTAAASGPLIRATVRDAKGQPAPSVRVEFTAPHSGATCTLSSSFAITDSGGVASVTCTPNCTSGTYSVTAQPLTATATANVTFTNASGPCRRRSARH